jgi:hypothetical protein
MIPRPVSGAQVGSIAAILLRFFSPVPGLHGDGPNHEEPRCGGVLEWAGVDSNHRPTDYESAALTI